MNKSELIDAISGSSGVGKGDIDSVLKALEEVVTSAVCGGGDKISLSGFLLSLIHISEPTRPY